nr:MAG: hydroxyacid dehydrogenase [Bacillota bacterium]
MHCLLVYHPREAETYRRLLEAAGYPGPIRIARDAREAVEEIGEAEILLAGRLPDEAWPHARRLRWIQSMWAGVEHWLRAPLPEGVVLTHMVGPFGPLMAEYVFAHLLALGQHLETYRRQQAEARWERHNPEPLRGRTLAVAGLGAIGTEIARVGRAFGMRVVGLSRSGKPHPLAEAVYTPDQIEAFCAQAQVLVLVLPHTPETEGLFGEKALSALPSGAILVNIGRGAILDHDALLRALESGRVRHAVLDVFPTEPLPPESPLWRHPRVTVTPHVAGVSLPEDVVAAFMANYRRYVAGEPLVGVVDRQRGY